jgi:hypothetical protein
MLPNELLLDLIIKLTDIENFSLISKKIYYLVKNNKNYIAKNKLKRLFEYTFNLDKFIII